MKKSYPFDSSIKSHLLIALGLIIWIFIFLYFTEPLDVNEFLDSQKMFFLLMYALIGGLLYAIVLPFQIWLYKKNNSEWKRSSEFILLILFIIISIFALRLFYLHFIVNWHPNAYDFSYHLRAIIFPAIYTILPIIIIARYSFGKYKEKRIEDQKIEIKGDGNYEGLRLLLNDLISIQSSDNYIEVFYVSGNSLKKALIRNKLSVISEEFPKLLRTHRSYLINPFHFQSRKNEKGKHLLLLTENIEVPISKTYLDGVNAQLNFTTT